MFAAPAQANLIIGCTSSTNAGWCTGFGTNQTANTFLSYTGSAGPYSVTELVTGEDLLGAPVVMEVHNFEINVTGAGQLSVFVSQTNMTAAGMTAFLLDFGTAQIVGNLTGVVRTMWLDYGTANQQNLGSCTGATNCTLNSLAYDTTGGYSLTEEFDMTAGRSCTANNACELSTDDKFSLIPEPATLGLLGTGLVAFGAFRRRRKAKKAA